MLPYQDRKRVVLWLQEGLLKTKEEKILTSEVLEHVKERLQLEWSSRMNRAMGMAFYSRRTGEVRIKLSTILWEASSDVARRETVYHELAHILVSAKRAFSGPSLRRFGERRSIHGPEWRSVMHRLGYPNADRCHAEVNDEFEKAKGKIKIYCACGSRGYWVTFKRAQLLLAAQSKCRRCKGYFQMREP